MQSDQVRFGDYARGGGTSGAVARPIGARSDQCVAAVSVATSVDNVELREATAGEAHEVTTPHGKADSSPQFSSAIVEQDDGAEFPVDCSLLPSLEEAGMSIPAMSDSLLASAAAADPAVDDTTSAQRKSP